jgi:hypothetical protein
MSFWVYLEQDGEEVSVENHEEGGTYAIGGTQAAELTVTYNYSPHYFRALDAEKGLRWLHGQKARACVSRMEKAVADLGTLPNRDPFWQLDFMGLPSEEYERWKARFGGKDLDAPENAQVLREAVAAGAFCDGGAYWKPTPGNAGDALNVLLAWARQHPDATFRVS